MCQLALICQVIQGLQSQNGDFDTFIISTLLIKVKIGFFP